MAWILEHASTIATLLGLLSTAWGMWIKAKKTARALLFEALEGRFATQDDLKKLEDKIGILVESTQVLIYQVAKLEQK